MVLLSAFIGAQLLKAIEHEFANHSEEIQKVILDEVQSFLAQGSKWLESKLNPADTNLGE